MSEQNANVMRIPVSAEIRMGAKGEILSTEYQYVDVTREEYINAMGELLAPFISSKLAERGIRVERRQHEEVEI